MNKQELISYSLLAAILPATAYASGGAVMILLYGILPCIALTLCFVIETLSAALLWKINFWRTLKGFFFANLVALLTLAIVSIGIFAMIQYFEIDEKYALAAPIIAVLIALKVKFSMSQKSLRMISKELIKLFMLSHSLALLALYYAHSYYVEIANAPYVN